MITPSSMQPTRSANDTAEFRWTYGSTELINALYALDAGYTGRGATIAVLDDGVNVALPAFAGQVSSLSKDFGSVTKGGVTTKRDLLGDERSNHGTPIAAIIVAKRDGEGTMGLAPDAKIAVLRIDDWNEDTATESLRHGITAIDYAASVGIKIVNASVTSGGLMPYGNAVARLGATGGLLIASAGNVGGANPADTNAVTDANRDAFLFVVAVNSALYVADFGIEPYSNRAGTMRERTVAAPGANMTTRVDGSISIFAGTSSAAPVVSALAAAILSKWPQLTGKQAGEVILNTARDIGAPGVDEVFGRGLVDFKAALSPVSPTLSNGAKVTSLQASLMGVPGSVGLTQLRAALSDVTVLDTYGRDFRGSLSDQVVSAERRDDRWLRRRIAGMGAAGGGAIAAGPFSGSLGFSTYRYGPGAADVATLATGGEVALQAGRTGVRAGINAREALQRDVMGLAPSSDGVLAYAPVANGSLGVDRFVGGSGGRIGLTFSAGRAGSASATAATLGWTTPETVVRVSWIEEDGTVLGAPSFGALALGRGTSMALVEARRAFGIGGGWRLEGYGSVGVTRLRIDAASLVTGATPLVGSRWGVQAEGRALGGLLTLGIAQPLTIESGTARLTFGSGYDLASRSLTYGTALADLSGGERRLRLTAGYVRGGPRSSLRVGLTREAIDGATRLLTGWSTRW